jgi:hypothetical protein
VYADLDETPKSIRLNRNYVATSEFDFVMRDLGMVRAGEVLESGDVFNTFRTTPEDVPGQHWVGVAGSQPGWPEELGGLSVHQVTEENNEIDSDDECIIGEAEPLVPPERDVYRVRFQRTEQDFVGRPQSQFR